MLNRILSLYYKLFLTDEQFARKIGVKIGSNCSIGTRFFGSEPYLIEIGNHVQITNEVRFLTHGACWVYRQEIPDIDMFGKIKIGNNVYIGNCAIILPGVTIADDTIIGAGSIVTKSFPKGVIIAGNPAKIIGSTDILLDKIRKYDLKTKRLNYKEKRNKLNNTDETFFIKK